MGFQQALEWSDFENSTIFPNIILQKILNLSLKWQKINFEIYYIEMKHPNDLVPQGVSKLQDVKFGSKNFKICHLVTLVPLEVQGCALLFLETSYQYL